MAHSARPKRTRLTWFGFGFGFAFGFGFGLRMGLRLGFGLEADEVHLARALSRLVEYVADLRGHRRGNGRLWRRLARAPEAVAGRSVARSLRWERRASQSCQARPGKAQAPTSGTTKRALLTVLAHVKQPDDRAALRDAAVGVRVRFWVQV